MKLYFAGDIVLMIDRAQNKKSHSHYAIQIIYKKSPLSVQSINPLTCTIINSNVDHFFQINDLCVSLLINPQSPVGNYFTSLLKGKDVLEINQPYHEKLLTLFDPEITEEAVNSFLINFRQHYVKDMIIDDRISDVLDYIEEREGLDINISLLSAMSYLSSTRFTHLFKEEVGTSVMKYIKWVRMVYALKYIIYDHKSISDGAYKYGFSDSAHFSRSFNKYFGINLKKILTIKNN